MRQSMSFLICDSSILRLAEEFDIVYDELIYVLTECGRNDLSMYLSLGENKAVSTQTFTRITEQRINDS